MRTAYFIAQSSQDDSALNRALEDWFLVAPHDGATQSWRLLLAASFWDRITPSSRAKALNDAEDLCVRYGHERTEQLVVRGLDSARLAVLSRLGRMSRQCVIVTSNLPPLIAQ
jgi:hypothetical protein